MSQPNCKSLADVVNLVRVEGASVSSIGAKSVMRLVYEMSFGSISWTHEYSIDIGTFSNLEEFEGFAIVEIIFLSILIPLQRCGQLTDDLEALCAS